MSRISPKPPFVPPPSSPPSEAPRPRNRSGDLSISWGYNRAAFSPSTLHLQGPGHALTLENVHASDRPDIASALDLINSVAQYNYRLSYQVSPSLNLSIGMDHMKYVMDPDQVVQATGHVDVSASPAHAGVYRNTPLRLGTEGSVLAGFEHTNGLNLLDVELAYTRELYAHRIFSLSARTGFAIGIVIPKSEVTLFGKQRDNAFHIAGYGVALTAALRADIGRYFFVEARLKAGLIHLPDVLTVDARASHAFAYVEPIAALGVNLPLGDWIGAKL